ncbi:MAG: diguanylate cyclase [Ignavibacteria bacterium]|nr:diguanylate cyclase [Ignavibacteria bacterium]
MDWHEYFSESIIVCDKDLTIIYLNKTALKSLSEEQRKNITGSNLLDYHNEDSNKKILGVKENLKPNVYTIEKAGKKKLIYQSLLLENNKFKGIVELSMVIPEVLLHFKRD